MASPSSVVTMGYGSFGSVNLLPTLGYGIGEEAESFPSDGWVANPRQTIFKASERNTVWTAQQRKTTWKARGEE